MIGRLQQSLTLDHSPRYDDFITASILAEQEAKLPIIKVLPVQCTNYYHIHIYSLRLCNVSHGELSHIIQDLMWFEGD